MMIAVPARRLSSAVQAGTIRDGGRSVFRACHRLFGAFCSPRSSPMKFTFAHLDATRYRDTNRGVFAARSRDLRCVDKASKMGRVHMRRRSFW